MCKFYIFIILISLLRYYSSSGIRSEYLKPPAASSVSALVIQNVGNSCSEDQRMCDDGSCISVDEECQNSGVPPRTPRRQTRQIQAGTCILPEHPANGTYSAHIPGAQPGDAHDLVIFNVTCSAGFALIGSSTVICSKGWWSEQMPKCISHCHLPSDPSVIYYCRDFGRVESSRDCNSYEMNGTVVRPQCRRPYYYSGGALADMLCVDGNWNYTAKCSPECGDVSSIGKPLVIDGATARRAELPWHAAVYSTSAEPYVQICGGSLVSTTIVISAAHCFWSNTGNKQPAAEYAVAVGKLHRPWSDVRDRDSAQTSHVSALHLPALFQGKKANNQEDIAVVVAATPFHFTSFVRPVCLDFDYNFQKSQLTPGNMGKVAGWGLTSENGLPSELLQVINMPFITAEKCIEDSPINFRGHITTDKFCAGYKNEHKGVCMGDSGGGLAFPEYNDKGTPRYYLQGIVSTAPTTNQLCNANFYTTFTQILKQQHFIKQFWKTGESRHEHFSKFWRTAEFSCLEKSLSSDDHSSPLYSVEDETLKHVTVRRDSAGRLAYLELHVAIQADEYVNIALWDQPSKDSIIQFDLLIGWNSNQFTKFKDGGTTFIQTKQTVDILSSTEFRAFYLKVDNGTLVFGKEGDSRPLVERRDERLGLLNYFGFVYDGRERATVRYDCPLPAPPAPPRGTAGR